MGFPSTNGFFSEFLLFQGGFFRATSAFSDYRTIVAILGVVATALTAGYSLLALRKIFFGPLNGDTANVKEAPWTITLPLIVLSIVTVVLGIYPGPIISRFAAIGRAIAGV
jgi:NADH-quinone oxidoreductase subunit M